MSKSLATDLSQYSIKSSAFDINSRTPTVSKKQAEENFSAEYLVPPFNDFSVFGMSDPVASNFQMSDTEESYHQIPDVPTLPQT